MDIRMVAIFVSIFGIGLGVIARVFNMTPVTKRVLGSIGIGLMVLGGLGILGSLGVRIRSPFFLVSEQAQPSTNSWSNASLVQVRNKTFASGVVKLDGYEFINCTFDDVILEYEGTAATRFTQISFIKKGKGERMMQLKSSNPAVTNTFFIMTAINLALGMDPEKMSIEESEDQPKRAEQ